jgi:hypothetical protein
MGARLIPTNLKKRGLAQVVAGKADGERISKAIRITASCKLQNVGYRAGLRLVIT